VFALIMKRVTGVTVPAFGALQLPFSFTPARMSRHEVRGFTTNKHLTGVDESHSEPLLPRTSARAFYQNISHAPDLGSSAP
jgi:hypothetical protein